MEKYAGIEKATMLIALDNGGINQFRSEEEQKEDLYDFLEERQENLSAIDSWLSSLTFDVLEKVCCGSSEEIEECMKNAPEGADDLLDDYFEFVC